MSWLASNWPTLLAALVVVGLVALSLRTIFPGKGKPSGCAGCSGCSGCAGCSACHSREGEQQSQCCQ